MSIAALHDMDEELTEERVAALVWNQVSQSLMNGLTCDLVLLPLFNEQDDDIDFHFAHALHSEAYELATSLDSCKPKLSVAKEVFFVGIAMTFALRVYDAVVVEMGVMTTLAAHIDAFRARYIDS